MSTYSSQSDLHRIISREREADAGHYSTPAHRPVLLDHSYLDHLGAHFACKQSFPNYPDGVEFSEDEATQPDRVVPGTVHSNWAQHSRTGGPPYGLSPVPAQNYSRDNFCISPEGFKEVQRQRAAKRGRKRCSSQSQQSRGSTPTQGYQPSSSTISGRSEHNGHGSSAPPYGHTFRFTQSVVFPENRTPSPCSVVTNEDEAYERGAGPSPPHPFSSWDRYHGEHPTATMDTDDNVWASSSSHELTGTSGSQSFPSSIHWNMS